MSLVCAELVGCVGPRRVSGRGAGPVTTTLAIELR